ncbi:MAG: LL-diaminopimelate aminotransferase [Nitrospirae bacterium]|nr:LL-diaminopimelate aminotransferase [Nitrospirota bacterium]
MAVETDSYIQSLIAERIGGARFGREDVIYKFEKIKRAKAQARREFPGVEIIDMGVGEPDEMAHPDVVEVLRAEAANPENRGYTDNGIQALKDAVPAYMERVYGVSGIDPNGEVIHSIGAKPALAMLAAAFVNPGDVILMTTPGYPVMGTHARWYGGRVVNLPLKEENGFLPDLDAVPPEGAGAKVLYLNYPNNPTGAAATREFYERAVDFARRKNVLVVSDAAYNGLVYGGARPLSFLAIPGAKEVGVEIHSFSKAYNMTGWRLAFLVGNPLAVSAFAAVKDNTDSGQFAAIQKAGIYCLAHPEITRAIAAKYERRLGMMVDLLRSKGFDARMPGGSFFLYVRAPRGIRGGERFQSAEEASQWLIRRKQISTVPWDDVGAYLRFSCTFAARGGNEERRVIDEVRRRLSDVEFEW